MKAIRVLIADDHPVFRYGLRRLLLNDSEIEVVGETNSAAGVVTVVDRLRPDLVLLDIRMPGPTGIDVVQELRRNHPEMKVLVLTAHDDDAYLLEALQAGVHGYLLKNASYEVLISAIHHVHADERVLTPEKISTVLEQFEVLAQKQARDELELTDTELKLLERLAGGDTYGEMSAHLCLSESTIRRKVHDIFTKMGVNSLTQAVAEAIRRDLI